MLIKATTEHNYETVDIDINNGTFKKSSVKMTETKIRVNKSILGEVLYMGGKPGPLGLDEVEVVAKAFNEVRTAAGFTALDFRTTEELPKKKEKKPKAVKVKKIKIKEVMANQG